jgi:hypothetical protein
MTEETKIILDRLDKVDTKMEKMEKSLRNEIKSIQLTLENVTNRNINIICEGHRDLTRKLDETLKVENEKEMLLIRMNYFENEIRIIKERLATIA